MRCTRRKLFRLYIVGLHVVAGLSIGLTCWFAYRWHHVVRRDEEFVGRYREVAQLLADQVGIEKSVQTADDILAVLDEIVLRVQQDPSLSREDGTDD